MLPREERMVIRVEVFVANTFLIRNMYRAMNEILEHSGLKKVQLHVGVPHFCWFHI